MRVAHVSPGMTPDNIGRYRPDELMTGLAMFDAKFQSGDE